MQQNKDIKKTYTIGSDENKNANDIFQTLSKMKIMRMLSNFSHERLLSPFSFNNNSCLNSIISTFFAAISLYDRNYFCFKWHNNAGMGGTSWSGLSKQGRFLEMNKYAIK